MNVSHWYISVYQWNAIAYSWVRVNAVLTATAAVAPRDKCMFQRLSTTIVQRDSRYGLTEHLQGIVCNTYIACDAVHHRPNERQPTT